MVVASDPGLLGLGVYYRFHTFQKPANATSDSAQSAGGRPGFGAILWFRPLRVRVTSASILRPGCSDSNLYGDRQESNLRIPDAGTL